MKHFFALLLSVLMVLSLLTACRSKPASPASSRIAGSSLPSSKAFA